MVLCSPHVKPWLLSRPNPLHGERRAGVLDLLVFHTKLREALGMQLVPRWDQYVCIAYRQNRVLPGWIRIGEWLGVEGGGGIAKVMLRLGKSSILGSFTSLSSEFIIPRSNANNKWGFLNMPVRFTAAGHLSFEGNRHKGVRLKTAKQPKLWLRIFCPSEPKLFDRRGESGAGYFSLFLFIIVHRFLVSSVNNGTVAFFSRFNKHFQEWYYSYYQYRPELGKQAFIRKHESCQAGT